MPRLRGQGERQIAYVSAPKELLTLLGAKSDLRITSPYVLQAGLGLSPDGVLLSCGGEKLYLRKMDAAVTIRATHNRHVAGVAIHRDGKSVKLRSWGKMAEDSGQADS